MCLFIITVSYDASNETPLNRTISKTEFIDYYNKFFVENNPMPEIADLYKENPDFFKLLAARLVKALPERFPLDYVENIFNKKNIDDAIQEMIAKNQTLDQYNDEKRKLMEEKMRKLEIQEEEKKKEEEKKRLEEQRLKELAEQQMNSFNHQKLTRDFYVSLIINNAWAYQDIKTEHDEFFSQIFSKAVMLVSTIVPENFEFEDLDEIGKKVEEKYKEIFQSHIKKLILDYFTSEDENLDRKLEVLSKEIDEDKISFKNLKSKYKFIIENDKSFKNFGEDEKETNKFGMETKVTIEDL